MFSNAAGADPFGAVDERYAGQLVPQGLSAEMVAERWNLSRAYLDELALASHRPTTVNGGRILTPWRRCRAEVSIQAPPTITWQHAVGHGRYATKCGSDVAQRAASPGARDRKSYR